MHEDTFREQVFAALAAGSSPAPRMLDFETLCVSSRSISDFQACRGFAWQSKTKAVDTLQAGAGFGPLRPTNTAGFDARVHAHTRRHVRVCSVT